MSHEPPYRTIELFQHIAKDDKDAYTAVFMQYYGHVHAKALAICKVPATAADATQQVFLKLWEKREVLTSVDHPEGWLMTLARNTVLDMLKRKAHNDKEKRVDP